jgi:hypothetical protein
MKTCINNGKKVNIGCPYFWSKGIKTFTCEPNTCYKVWTIYKYSWNCELAPRYFSIGEIEGRYCDSIEWLKKNNIWKDYVPNPSGDCTYIEPYVKTIERFQISLPNKKD